MNDNLNYGAVGFFKFNNLGRGPIITYPVIVGFTDGSLNNAFWVYQQSSNGYTTTALNKAGVALGTPGGGVNLPLGTYTVVFAVSETFAAMRFIGGTQFTRTEASLPIMDRLVIGGRGYDVGSNSYQVSKNLGLIYGTPYKPINQALFDEVYETAKLISINAPTWA